MDVGQFDALTWTLTTSGSRRRVLGGLLPGSLGFFGARVEQAAAKKKKPCPPCKKRKKGKCKAKLPDGTACENGGTCQSGSCRATTVPPDGGTTTVPPDGGTETPPPRLPNASCNVQENATLFAPVGQRIAQTFTEPNGGKLTAVLLVLNNEATTTGDYVLQINTVDPSTGFPTNNTIASIRLPGSQVGNNPDFVTFNFPTPATLAAGSQYALVHSRPNGSGFHDVHVVEPGPCPGGELFVSSTQTGTFARPYPNQPGRVDMSYITDVSP